MKMINDVDISICDFSADVVPYMYGEMSPTGMFAFESHLPDCEKCTNELADVSYARYEVYDWKKLEFDPLPTPRMLPFEDAATVAVGSWLDGLRAAFGGWLVPTSALAAVAIGAVITAVFYLAGSTAPEITKIDVPTPTVAQPGPSPLQQPVVTGVATPKDFTDPSVVRASTSKDSQRKSVRVTRTPSVRPVQAVAKREVKRVVPRLDEFTDDEDTSLRLAMLFDDLDTRD